MLEAFSLAPSRCAIVEDPDLRREIHAHTGSDEATASILRSLGRFGADPSIERFEMIPAARGRSKRAPDVVAWTVHAVRAGADAGAEADEPSR